MSCYTIDTKVWLYLRVFKYFYTQAGRYSGAGTGEAGGYPDRGEGRARGVGQAFLKFS